ncbi:MAG TPA: hypothetical protein VK177_16940 [Flavobacteriales bacterium]|nr:hypothetical protein [Flavobacteriales bacterium]
MKIFSPFNNACYLWFCVTGLSISTISAQDLQWVKVLGDSGNAEHTAALVADDNGNVYSTGYYIGPSDLDPGPGYHYLYSSSYGKGTFVSKLDANGNFIWAKGFASGNVDEGSNGAGIGLDDNKNVYITGTFGGTVDFNPGPIAFNITANNSFDPIGVDPYVVKLDSNGNFLWAKSFSGPRIDFASDIEVTGNGYCYITGNFRDSVDFDPGPGTSFLYNPTSPLVQSTYIVKLDPSGNLVWVKNIPTSVPKQIALDSLENVYAVGYFLDTVDFDPGPLVHNIIPASNFAGFVWELDSAGNFVKSLCFDVTAGAVRIEDIAFDHKNDIYLCGYYSDTIDADPGPGIYNLSDGTGAWTGAEIFVCKLKNNGDFEWAGSMGGIYNDEGTVIALDENGRVYVSGYFDETVDFDMGPGSYPLTTLYGWEMYILNLDTAGNFLTVKHLPGTSLERAYDLFIKDDFIYLGGSIVEFVDFGFGHTLRAMARAKGLWLNIRHLLQQILRKPKTVPYAQFTLTPLTITSLFPYFNKS